MPPYTDTGRYSSVAAAYSAPVLTQKRRTAGESPAGRGPGAMRPANRKKPVAAKKNGTARRASVFSAKSHGSENEASGAVWMQTTSSAAAMRKRSTPGYPRRAVTAHPTV